MLPITYNQIQNSKHRFECAKLKLVWAHIEYLIAVNINEKQRKQAKNLVYSDLEDS